MIWFISIAFVVVKLKISSSFFEGFWALTSTMWSNIAEILTRGSTLAKKTLFEKVLKDPSIYGKSTDQKLAHLVQL